MRVLYAIGIYSASFILKLFAQFNPKLKRGLEGRKQTFKTLKTQLLPTDKTLWFHCASLGEYEQGLPVFEALKTKYPDYKIVLSFFSPSGYDIRKHSSVADVVVYLPFDTTSNAKLFLDLVHPDYIVFVKYDIWPNFLNEIKKRQLKAILISAVFRRNQFFFKWYGRFIRSSLFAFQHIFTQNEESLSLLNSTGYLDATVSGDTRFDRVLNQLKVNNSIPFIEDFKDNKLCVILGSSWPDDDKLFMDYINECSSKNIKFIIAPHNIDPKYIASIRAQLNVNHISYSQLTGSEQLQSYDVFILDTIGYLSKAYSYADIAYVGGAAGTTGLHNILEPAVFGIPILIGRNYHKFPEAIALVKNEGVISIRNKSEFETTLSELLVHQQKRQQLGLSNKTFIEDNDGAVVQILDYIRI